MLNTGAPHFRSLVKQHRQSNYTFDKFIYECIDNVIKKCTEINIYTDIDDNGKLQEVRISDNYQNGFENINETGVHNPMNMGHFSNYHDNDDETSEYGVGLKAGSISAANQLDIITKVPLYNMNYHIIADFIRMSEEPDVNLSYNPKIKNISNEEYMDIHPFNFGSTIKITKIRDATYHNTTKDEITNNLIRSIGKTYSRLLPFCQIKVNGKDVIAPHNFFDDEKCTPFTITGYIYILKDQITDNVVHICKKIFTNSQQQRYSKYDENDKRWRPCNKEIIEEYMKNCVSLYPAIDNNLYAMEVKTTFTFYSDKFHNKDETDMDRPQDVVNIYKDNRLYGSKSFVNHNNGSNNYTIHEIIFKSKAIGKNLGITYNKEITMDGSNNLINCIKAIIADNRSQFTSDTTTNKNSELCEKALKLGLIDLLTSPSEKLSKIHYAKREHELNKIHANNIIQTFFNESPQQVLNETVNTEFHSEQVLNESVNTESQSEQVLNETVNIEDQLKQVLNETVYTEDQLKQVLNETVNTEDQSEQVLNETVNTEFHQQVLNESVNTEFHQQVLNESINTESQSEQVLNKTVNTESSQQFLNESVNIESPQQVLNETINTESQSEQVLNENIDLVSLQDIKNRYNKTLLIIQKLKLTLSNENDILSLNNLDLIENLLF